MTDDRRFDDPYFMYDGKQLRKLLPPDDWADLMRHRRIERLKIAAVKAREAQQKREARAAAKLEAARERRRKKGERLLKYGDHSMPEEPWEPPWPADESR